MSNYSKLVGLRNVGSYQVSGTPWMTGSGGATGFPAEKVHRHTFPSVTKSVTIICTGGTDIRVAFQNGYTTFSPFTEDGFAGQKTYSASEVTMVNANYITVPASNGSVTFDVKCKEIFLTNHQSSTSGYEIFAELTGIPTGSMFSLTGSGISV